MPDPLVFSKDGVEYMTLCVDLTVYWAGPASDHVDGILHFYNVGLDLLGSGLKHYATEEMPYAEPISDAALSILPQWLAGADPTKDIFTLNLETNPVPDMPSDAAFDIWAVEYPEDPAGMMRMILPVDFVQGSPEKLVELARESTGSMAFHSGHGGYAINWDHKGEYAFPARREMAVLSRRYPGIELPEVAVTLMALYDGMKRVNWLTLAGNALLDSVDDRDALVARLDSTEGVVVEPLSGGILVVAGPEPKLGDVNRQEDLGAYHAVGRELAPLRSKDHPPFLVDQRGRADEELTEEWLGYFDGDSV